LKASESEDSMTAAVAETPVAQQFAGGAVAGLAASTTPGRLLATVGDPQPRHVAAAHQLLEAMPLDLSVAAHEPGRAPCLVYALLLDDDATARNQQLELLKKATDDNPAIAHDTQACHREIQSLDRRLRLPLLELTMPALRALPRDQRAGVRKLARDLAMADEHLSAFEFALIKALEKHVHTSEQPNVKPRGRQLSLQQCADYAAMVLSVIAHAGAPDDEEKAAAAFARGKQALSLSSVTMTSTAQAKPQDLDEAIEQLARMSPFGKRNLITACAEVAAHDGQLDPDEVDLVRALGELWDCPVPLTVDDE